MTKSTPKSDRRRAPVVCHPANDNSPFPTALQAMLAGSSLVPALDFHNGKFSKLLLTRLFWTENYGAHADAGFRALRRENLARLTNDAMASLVALPEPVRVPVSTTFVHLLIETPFLSAQRQAALRESEGAAEAVAEAWGRLHDMTVVADLAASYRDMLTGYGSRSERLVALHALALPLPDDAPALVVVSAQDIVDALLPTDRPLQRRRA